MMSCVSFGAVSSQQETRPLFHDSYRFCFSARFARRRSRLLASTSRLAANSACKIARLTPRGVRTFTIPYWLGASSRVFSHA
jgi:hypothetical protein